MKQQNLAEQSHLIILQQILHGRVAQFVKGLIVGRKYRKGIGLHVQDVSQSRGNEYGTECGKVVETTSNINFITKIEKGGFMLAIFGTFALHV